HPIRTRHGSPSPRWPRSLRPPRWRPATVTTRSTWPSRRGAAPPSRAGRVRAIRAGALDPTPVIDLRDTIASGGERGLLGLTFSPDGATLYVDYTNRRGDTRADPEPMR